MLTSLSNGLLFLFLLISAASAVDIEFPHCNCDGDEGFWSIQSILQCQKVSDFLIATAYFSIPLELLYFVSCSNVFPFKWILFQFCAFIVLCGLTHLLNVFTYEPHSFLIMLLMTTAKFLTALVSFATAITLLTLIPQLLRVKVRENFLRLKARELDREVGLKKMQEEAHWHVRMLMQEIRKSLDRHTILYTTLVELSKTLELQNCAVWMPNEEKTHMNLTHELRRNTTDAGVISIPINDVDVLVISEKRCAAILRPDSLLARKSIGGVPEPGEVAAIRMPLLKVSDFKGGTPEMIEGCYAILVLVLPRDDSRTWSQQELEIVEVVADQVAVALSHASVLEESQMMRDKLVERNRALQQARTEAMMATKARNMFQGVMSQSMRSPMHSISGFLSLLQLENLSPEQKLILDGMEKASDVTTKLIDDIMESPGHGSDNLSMETKLFNLKSTVRNVASITKALCVCRNFDFSIHVENELPDTVVGDEKRIVQLIMSMVGNLLGDACGGSLTFLVCPERQTEGGRDQMWIPWMSSSTEGCTTVKFEIAVKRCNSKGFATETQPQLAPTPFNEGVEKTLSFSMCRKLVQIMQGNIWAVSNSEGAVESMKLLLRLLHQPQNLSTDFLEPSTFQPSGTQFKGVNVLLVEDDTTNRTVTQKLLEKIGCHVCSVSSGLDCLSHLGGSRAAFEVVILNIHLNDVDGFELATKIRKLRSRSWPLIVALTSSSQEDVWERCLMSGIIGVIQKPVKLQGIVDELRRILRKT